MASTLSPFVATYTMGPLGSPDINLSDVLYIHMMPYIPSAWITALSSENLLASFPNPVHNITYGSPIGNPPHFLIFSFLQISLLKMSFPN